MVCHDIMRFQDLAIGNMNMYFQSALTDYGVYTYYLHAERSDGHFQDCHLLEMATIILFEYMPITSNPDSLTNNNCFLMQQLSVHCGCASIYGESPCPI
jgi:hypothetical protein